MDAFNMLMMAVAQLQAKPKKYVKINLNNQWKKSSVANPNASLYNIYESYSNKGVDGSTASMTVTICGYTEFTCYIRSYAESSYDYVQITELDSTTIKNTTSGRQNINTSLDAYTAVTYTNISEGEHTITISYKKDGSVSSGYDTGYALIPNVTEEI